MTSYTITTFCAAEEISRAHLYHLWNRGLGPRFYMVGNRRRITPEARQEWHRQLEAKTGHLDIEATAKIYGNGGAK